jgi:hypothetical protein
MREEKLLCRSFSPRAPLFKNLKNGEKQLLNILLFTEQMGQGPHDYVAVCLHRTEPQIASK